MMLDAVFDVVGTVESSVLGSCALRLERASNGVGDTRATTLM